MKKKVDHAKLSGVKSKRKKLFLIIPLIIAAILGSIGINYFSSKQVSRNTHAAANITPGQTAAPALTAPQTPAPLRAIQEQQLAAGTSTATTKKLFEVTGGNYYFAPNSITVNSGDKVTIIFLDRSGSHDLVIDDFQVKTPRLFTGQPAVATFIADKKGTYQFYSNVGQDLQNGMKGTLVVQ